VGGGVAQLVLFVVELGSCFVVCGLPPVKTIYLVVPFGLGITWSWFPSLAGSPFARDLKGVGRLGSWRCSAYFGPLGSTSFTPPWTKSLTAVKDFFRCRPALAADRLSGSLRRPISYHFCFGGTFFFHPLSGVKAAYLCLIAGVLLLLEHMVVDHIDLAFFKINVVTGFVVFGMVFWMGVSGFKGG
jgi:hypothetical protein